jgi:broad specificity phosphatase PhoE
MSNRIHLLRHGQYSAREGTGDGPLTGLGRRQASRAATRLCASRIGKVYSSDLERATETATILIGKMKGLSYTALPMLREIAPTGVPGIRIPLAKRRLGKERIEEIIKRFFSRPPRSGDTVLVCHGNLIRAVLCRVLGTPLTKWHRFGTSHCAITSFSFRPDGLVYVRCVNDTGHLPPTMTTTV